MREIKFRGKRVDNGEWVYGDLLQNNGFPIIVCQVGRSYIGFTDVGVGKHWHIETPAYKVIPETVGRYTGRKDKNGKEIYEGDIITTIWGNVSADGVVGFSEKEGMFKVKWTNDFVYQTRSQSIRYTKDGEPLLESIDQEFRVVNNIHELSRPIKFPGD